MGYVELAKMMPTQLKLMLDYDPPSDWDISSAMDNEGVSLPELVEQVLRRDRAEVLGRVKTSSTRAAGESVMCVDNLIKELLQDIEISSASATK